MDWLKPGMTVYVRDENRDDWVGRLIAFHPGRIVELENAVWVANSGRWHQFMSKGTAPEMELEPGSAHCVVAWVNVWEWPHNLPTKAV